MSLKKVVDVFDRGAERQTLVIGAKVDERCRRKRQNRGALNFRENMAQRQNDYRGGIKEDEGVF